MKAVAVALIAVLFSVQNTYPQSNGKAVGPYRAESSAQVVRSKDAWTFVTENRSFRFAEVVGDDGNFEELLLEETYHNEHTDGREGVKGNATLKAWALERGFQDHLLWTFKEVGNEGTVQDRFYRVTAWGCCDAPIVYFYYSLLTGKKLYVSNSDLLEIWVADGGPAGFRYVSFGYTGTGNLDQPPQLQYGTDKKIVQRYSVVSSRQYSEPAEIFVSKDEGAVKSLDLRGSPTNFAIVLRYKDRVELHIPVEADTIRPDKARFPIGYSLRMEN